MSDRHQHQQNMRIDGVGIVGTGLWEGPPIGNDHFGPEFAARASVKDPYRGRRSDDGSVHVAGMRFHPGEHARTIAAIQRSFEDPYRGTHHRRYFPADLKVSEAETEAARKAIADAGLEPADIGAVLVQSFLADELQPKNAALIAHNLGITRAPAWEIDSICNSSLTQMTVGSSLMMSGFARHVLCVQSVAYSRVLDPGSSSSVQEGDLAAAYVLGPSPGTRMWTAWRTDGRLHGAIKLHWATPTGSAPRRFWEGPRERLLIGFDGALQEQVMSEIAENARTVCDDALRRAELRRDEIDLFIAHQPMSWNRAFLSDVLGLADGVAFDTFADYANVNSAAITASMHAARKEGRLRKGTRALFFGPSAGYTYAAVAMRW